MKDCATTFSCKFVSYVKYVEHNSANALNKNQEKNHEHKKNFDVFTK